MSKLKSKLDCSIVEKDNENIWRSELLSRIDDSKISSPFGGDGLLEAKNNKSNKDLRTLLEFKFDVDLKNKLTQCNILIQCLYYIKKYENAGQKLPSTIFVSDTDECFAIHTNAIIKYLGYDVDWKIAPSEAHRKNPKMIQEMVDDSDILPFVYNVDNSFNIQFVVDKLWDLTNNVVRKIRITKDNIVNIYDYFFKNVLKDCKLTTNEIANLFIQLVVNPNDNYIHPKKSVVVTKSYGEIVIVRNQFKSFFSHFEGDIYSPKEKEGLTALVDRLVEDETRRKKGEFFTPTAFVDLAHTYINNVFGDDWKDRFVVWDNSCGTMNLTRDYRFKELYCSTLEQSDIDTANQMGYNPEATKFQYDFLNGDYDALPKGLRDAIDGGKEILFLINPPYATARTDKNESDSKTGVAKNKINTEMLNFGFGEATKNLYTQFLYKILSFNTNNNVKIGMFSPNLFLTSKSFKNFNTFIKDKININGGFLMDARNFDGTSMWPISFTMFSNDNPYSNKFDMLDQNIETFGIENFGVKELDMIDEERACDWIKLKGNNSTIVPNLSSTLKIKNTEKRGVDNMLCVLNNGTNRVEQNEKQCSFLSSMISNNTGVPVNKDNFLKTTVLFTARKSIKQTWFNMKDEYLVPNINHPQYKQYESDSIVYSIFNNRSYQSSLRNITYKDKNWDIKNEFFWMSKQQMVELADNNEYDELYRDARNESNRYVYLKLFGEGVYDLLSADAKEVLDMATELVKKSIKMRKLISDTNPEYHLNSWDAGYAQLKLVWKEYFKDEFDAFRKSYKRLEDRMRPLVYELGFLKS